MTEWDLLLTDARLATLNGAADDYDCFDGYLAIKDGRIAWLGAASATPPGKALTTRSLAGLTITPALIDCHTHLIFGGNRAAEFEQRLNGVSYEAIARAGGGILSTVRATRAASHDELFDSALPRLASLAAEGVATVEIKSGYGLDHQTEIKMLEVAASLNAATAVDVQSTLLAAHALPPEFTDNVAGYLDIVCNDIIPEVAERKLAVAVDAYCESIAFDTTQVARVFAAAKDHGLLVKLHADQLSASGGAELAAEYGALSADHLEYSTDNAIQCMANAGTAAVLLPGAYLTLGETMLPPVNAMRKHKVPMAIASDVNPGTSPICSLRAAMILATRLFKLTPLECLLGTTRHAAAALGLKDRGTLDVGKRADLAVWNIDHPRELGYWLGQEQLAESLIGGHTSVP